MRRILQIEENIGLSEDMCRALLLKNEQRADLAIKAFTRDLDYVEKTFGFEIGANEVPTTGDVLCPVCFCEYPVDEFVHLPDCGHGLCTYCYTGYLTSKVGDGTECVVTTCPDSACKMIVPERLFKQLLDQTLYARYHDFLEQSFVDLSNSMKWCPGTDCSSAVEY